ncbi:MAG: RNA methyltransferase [Bacteroidaceae bacterium]|nr:RNA methyltransferase [Bacteroidaceae bacterium]
MISKSILKLIRSLDQKKVRKECGLFIAEGGKSVGDLLNSDIRCKYIIATSEWLASHTLPKEIEIIKAKREEIERASFLRSPQGVIGIFHQRNEKIDPTIAGTELCLALDDIQDPGNLGTIVRIADWFGIEHIFCSQGTADIYNPKAVQATMGAIGRIHLHYTSLPQLLEELKDKIPIYGTFLDGENMYEKRLEKHGIIVMGNEGNGIGNECAKHISERLFIPNYPIGRPTSESLNVSMATAIICAEFRRQ